MPCGGKAPAVFRGVALAFALVVALAFALVYALAFVLAFALVWLIAFALAFVAGPCGCSKLVGIGPYGAFVRSASFAVCHLNAWDILYEPIVQRPVVALALLGKLETSSALVVRDVEVGSIFCHHLDGVCNACAACEM